MAEVKLSKEEVLKIAQLARLSLSEDEVELYQKQLGRVLEHVRQLNELKTSDEAFVRHVPDDAISIREDNKESFEGRETILENAPQVEEGCFVLPPILDE